MTEFRRFFSEKNNFDGKIITLDHEEHHHLRDVLRAKRGDRIVVSFGDGIDYLCDVCEITGERTLLSVVESRKNDSELLIPVTLFQASLKNDKMELIVQKAVELGVNVIFPVKSRYTVGSSENKLARLQKIAFEAMKQCGRAQAVEVFREIPFEDMIEKLPEYSLTIFCDETELDYSIHSALKDLINCDSIAVIVGCEGGFSPFERESLADSARSVTLGKRILRAETAAISVLSIVSSYLDSKLK